jgi:TetR/AcrR family transcriptional regulator, transcriptional repressor for nem operon
VPQHSTRNQIVEEADALFYANGFENTSFSDIAAVVGISRGNFYHHFKTKDEILDAVITRRLGMTRDMLGSWEAESASPADRIISFVRILVVNRAAIMAFGCPVGTLCVELAKLKHAAQGQAAGIFDLFANWLAMQFVKLGQDDRSEALAMHLLARTQGVAVMASAFHDENFIRKEVKMLEDWIKALPNQ